MTTERELRALLRERAGRAPDPAAVHARTRVLVVRRRRRRRAGAAGGLALAAAGLALGLPRLDLLGPPPPPAAPAAPTPTAVPHLEQLREEYRSRGYGPEDTELLARLWQLEDAHLRPLEQEVALDASDVLLVEAVAGQRLLDGAGLPLGPGESLDPVERPELLPLAELSVPLVDDALAAYDAAGYTAADTEGFAREWDTMDLRAVEAVVGVRELDRQAAS
jgi:hypothetical protein